MEHQKLPEDEKARINRQKKEAEDKLTTAETPSPLITLQHKVGNRAVQRMLAQRSGNAPAEIDDELTKRINRERGGGQSLDSAVQRQMGEAMGQDFSSVSVHTSPESNNLNQELGAKAFTTGSDIFFKEGAYQPGTSSGNELISHELTHVVQQGSGSVGSTGGQMTVNAPGDAYEQEAEAVSKAVSGGETIQRQELDEDEDKL